jgi:predicted HTH domain antitoxin
LRIVIKHDNVLRQKFLRGNEVRTMVHIVGLELLEDELKAVVRAGNYRSTKEAVGHALDVLLAANAQLRVSTAVELYRRGKVTLSRAAETANMELETFKEELAGKGVPIRVDESPEEIRAGAHVIHHIRNAP